MKTKIMANFLSNLCKTSLVFVVIFVNFSNSIKTSELYTYYDEETINLPHGDSLYEFIVLETPIHFYSEKYDHIYINTNGILTFSTEFSEYLNQPFPLEYPSIAPFYSNVDTSAGNESSKIVFAKSHNHDKIFKASQLVRASFLDSYDFEATALYIATWENVGHYKANNNKLNTFQVLILCDKEETYVQFLYPENGLNWLQAEVGELGLPDVRAQAGFISEDGRFFSLEGSGTDNVRFLTTDSNVNVPGVWIYRVGELGYSENVEGPTNVDFKTDRTVPSTCSSGGYLKCHSSAECYDTETGFCCKCLKGYYGNGFNCIKSTVPLRVAGSISGSINGQQINDNAKLQSYVVMSDGRSYTAVNPINPEFGHQLQIILPIGGAIGWLFAKPIGSNKNGFQYTGGYLRHLSTLKFKNSPDILTVKQEFTGLNFWDQLSVKIEISGSMPHIPVGTRVQVHDLTEQYDFITENVIQSTGMVQIEIPAEGRIIEYELQQNIEFEKCAYDNDFVRYGESVTLQKVSKLSLDYHPQEQAIRIGMLNKIGVDPHSNPCTDGTANCGDNTLCIPQDDENYDCVCQNGFAPYLTDSDTEHCVDIDECHGSNVCDDNAHCQNTAGGYSCTCFDGYIGNGNDCVRPNTGNNIYYGHEETRPTDQTPFYNYEEPKPTDYNPYHVQQEEHPTERNHYYGNEEHPTERNHYYGNEEHPTERNHYYANENQTPTEYDPYHSQEQPRPTEYNPYYTYEATRPTVPYYSQEDSRPTGYDSHYPTQTTYESTRPTGYGPYYNHESSKPNYYDPYYSQEQGKATEYNPYYGQDDSRPTDPTQYNTHHEQSRPTEYRPNLNDPYYRNEEPTEYNPHYSHHSHSPQGSGTCDRCSRNAYCYNSACICNEGYVGDGYTCNPICRSDETYANGRCVPNYTYEEADLEPFCDEHGHCSCIDGYDFIIIENVCRYNGYDSETGSRQDVQITCDVDFNCHENATCEWSEQASRHVCLCPKGYEGDGVTCNKIEVSCTTHESLCNVHASCLYNEIAGKSQCKCDHGYEGDGFNCQLAPECTINDHCGENAYCDNGVCLCKTGFERDISDFCVTTGSCGGAFCADNAICKMEPHQKLKYCECMEGYLGDGVRSCKSAPIPCNVRNTCGLYASCIPNYRDLSKHECVCDSGYYGDGYVCVEEKNCRNTPSLCDDNAKCTTTTLGLQCICNPGYLGNGTYCMDVAQHESGFLLISQGVVVIRIPFDGKLGRPISAAQMAIGLDKDCAEGRVYWGDISAKKIMSSKYDGTDAKAFITEDILSPEGIAIDWMSRRLYWADSTKDTIEVASLDNPNQRTIIVKKHLVNPRGIAVDPYKNKLYWSDWNRDAPKIEMSELDGTGREILLSQPSVILPNSLNVLRSTGELCYADAGNHKIECMDTYTKAIRSIASNLSYPFGLTSTEEHFYWTDWTTKQIESVDIHGSRKLGMRTPVFGSHKMYGMTAITDVCPVSYSPCQIDNGGCPPDRICLVNDKAPSSKSCKCITSAKCSNEIHIDS